MKLWIDNIRSARQGKLFPIYYCYCCRKCKLRDKTKSIFDDIDCLCTWCDFNGLGIITIIPKIFYVINWCKVSYCFGKQYNEYFKE